MLPLPTTLPALSSVLPLGGAWLAAALRAGNRAGAPPVAPPRPTPGRLPFVPLFPTPATSRSFPGSPCRRRGFRTGSTRG